MTKSVDLDTAKLHLHEIVFAMGPGSEVLITEGNLPVARIVPVERLPRERTPGLGRGQVWVSEDFDAPLPDGFWAEET